MLWKSKAKPLTGCLARMVWQMCHHGLLCCAPWGKKAEGTEARPCRSLWSTVLSFFFSPNRLAQKEALLPDPSFSWGDDDCKTQSRMCHTVSLCGECHTNIFPRNLPVFFFFFWKKLFLMFFLGLSGFWKVMAKQFMPWRPRSAPIFLLRLYCCPGDSDKAPFCWLHCLAASASLSAIAHLYSCSFGDTAEFDVVCSGRDLPSASTTFSHSGFQVESGFSCSQLSFLFFKYMSNSNSSVWIPSLYTLLPLWQGSFFRTEVIFLIKMLAKIRAT